MLVSIHVPKTAGTSFAHLLRAHFGERLLIDNDDRPLAPHYVWRRLMRRLAGATRTRRLAGFECVHGHFLANAFDRVDAPLRRIAWVRDPVERVASHYAFWKRAPPLGHPDGRRLARDDLSLGQFAALPRMRNVQARFFAGYAPRDFAFVGIVDDMPASLRRLAAATGIGTNGIARENANADRAGARYAIDAAVRAEILRLNALDAALYADACRLHERACP